MRRLWQDFQIMFDLEVPRQNQSKISCLDDGCCNPEMLNPQHDTVLTAMP